MRSLIEESFIRIIPYGFSQLVNVATRHFPGQESAGLDHIFTNIPEKIQEVKTIHWGGSDHMMLLAVRKARSMVSHPSYVRKRSYKQFDPVTYVSMVKAVSWLSVYLCEDVNKAVIDFSNKLTRILDVMCTLKKFQTHPEL